jgi:hypothetical protein
MPSITCSLTCRKISIHTNICTIGVALHASGFFDFDGDKENERWVTLRHRSLEGLQFWIWQRSKGANGLMVDTVEIDRPTIIYLDPAYIADEGLQDIQPVVFLDSKRAFRMKRLPGSAVYLSGVPLRPSTRITWQRHRQGRTDLFNGVDPRIVQKGYDQPGRILPRPDLRQVLDCDPYYYRLGLASELAGKAQGAVDAYLYLWWNYSKALHQHGAWKLNSPVFTPGPRTPIPLPSPHCLRF